MRQHGNRDPGRQLEILRMQVGVVPEIAAAVANCAEKIRSLSLKQQPSISEYSNWAKYLSTMDESLDKSVIPASYGMIAKNREDQQRLIAAHLF